MPRNRPRSRRRRFIGPLGIGIAVALGITFIVAGNGAAPPPVAGGVAGATDTTSQASRTPDVAVVAATPAPTPTPAPTRTPLDATPDPTPAIPDAAGADPGGAPPLESLTGYRWPIQRPRLTLPFGPTPWGGRIVDGEKFHDGIDLATFCGDKVVAAHDGAVLAAGRRYDDHMGWIGDLSKYKARLDAKKLWITLPIVVVIDDGNGYRSIYAHFGKVVVKKGQTVKAGSLLGYEGRTGRASGCHLHYGLFSPYETAEFLMDPAAGKRMRLPAAVIARVDPLLVLPERQKPASKPKPTPQVSPKP